MTRKRKVPVEPPVPTAEQIKNIGRRLMGIFDEQASLREASKELTEDGKGFGIDMKVMRKAIKRLHAEAEVLEREDHLTDLYQMTLEGTRP